VLNETEFSTTFDAIVFAIFNDHNSPHGGNVQPFADVFHVKALNGYALMCACVCCGHHSNCSVDELIVAANDHITKNSIVVDHSANNNANNDDDNENDDIVINTAP
jgi:hypothetical protein